MAPSFSFIMKIVTSLWFMNSVLAWPIERNLFSEPISNLSALELSTLNTNSTSSRLHKRLNYNYPNFLGFAPGDSGLAQARDGFEDAMTLASNAAGANYDTDTMVQTIFLRYFPDGTQNRVQSVFEVLVGATTSDPAGDQNNLGAQAFAEKFWIVNGPIPMGEWLANPCDAPLSLPTYLRNGWIMGTSNFQIAQPQFNDDVDSNNGFLVVCNDAWYYPSMREIGIGCPGLPQVVSTRMVSLGALLLHDLLEWGYPRGVAEATSMRIVDLHDPANDMQQNLVNAVRLGQMAEHEGSDQGALALVSSWSYVYFSLDLFYSMRCGAINEAAPMMVTDEHCPINHVWQGYWLDTFDQPGVDPFESIGAW